MPTPLPLRRRINENGLAYRQRLRNCYPQEAVEVVNEIINRRGRRRQRRERPQEQRNEQEQHIIEQIQPHIQDPIPAVRELQDVQGQVLQQQCNQAVQTGSHFVNGEEL